MTEYFPEVASPVKYEGPDTDSFLAFRHFDPERLVAGKTMAEHLRFAVAYWHTFKGTGRDIFGGDVYQRPWNEALDPMDQAEATLKAAFEFCQKLGVNYYCFP